MQVEQVEALRPIAAELSCTLGQLALAWCMRNPNVSTVITGATSVAQVHENLKACDVVGKLTPAVVARVEKAMGDYAPQRDKISKEMEYRLRPLSTGALSKL